MGSLYLIFLITITLAKFEEKDTVSINKQLNNQSNSSNNDLCIYRIYCLILVLTILTGSKVYKSYRCLSYHQLILGNYFSFTLSCCLAFADKNKACCVYYYLVANTIAVFIIGGVILGFGCAAMFPTLLGYGMNNTNYSSPKVSSYLIMSGSIGASICLFISGSLGEHIDK